jgi:hypothetical protein
VLVAALALSFGAGAVGAQADIPGPEITAVSPAFGSPSGGTTVTITGTGFLDSDMVDFGNKSATNIVDQTATQLTATSPNGTGIVDITVTNVRGISDTVAADQFTYEDAPTVTSVSPNSGSGGGGTAVTIIGTGFSDETSVKFGSASATNIDVSDSTAMLVWSPAGTGTVDITVTNPAGTSAISSADHFTYKPLPVVTAVANPTGPAAGGATILIQGSNFQNAQTVLFGSVSLSSSQFSLINSEEIELLSPAGTGSVDVRIVTTAGTSATSAADRYTYLSVPTVTDVSPSNGPTTGGTSVTVFGAGFTDGTTVHFDTALGTDVIVNNSTTLTVTAPANTGTVDITVTTPGGTSATSAMDVYQFVASPTVISVSPSMGLEAGGNSVTILGTNFTSAYAVTFGATLATSVVFNSATSLTAIVPPGTGTVDVVVTTLGGSSPTGSADQFTYLGPPVITSVLPDSGPASGGTRFTVFGSGFDGLYSLYVGSVPATNVTIVSPTEVMGTTPAGTGTADVVIGAQGGVSQTTAADQFTYIAAPRVTSISPSRGPTSGGTTVTITGSNLSGATAVNFGASVATIISVDSASQVTATAPAGSSGTVDVRVTSAGGTSPTVGGDQFTYVPAPLLGVISPNSGPSVGGTAVTIAGADLSGATSVTFGGVPATIVADTPAIVSVVSPAGTGTVDIRITTAGGTSDIVENDQFTYIALPGINSVSPNRGPEAGGTSVTITGGGFTGASEVKFGAADAASITVNSASSITATTPPGTGTVDVTVVAADLFTTTTVTNAFTYVGAPAVVSISPTEGQTSGGTAVVITVNSAAPVTAVDFGGSPATSFTIDSATQVTAVAPAGAGTVDVTVTSVGGTSPASPVDEFTYLVGPTVTAIDPVAGPLAGGTVVTITGTGFGGATAVEFGGTSATSFTVNSATSISATSPVGSGTVDVTVTTAGGTSPTSSADQFAYAPVPTVTGISPSAGALAGGTVVTITGSGFTNATVVKFGPTDATSVVSTSTPMGFRSVSARVFTVTSATTITATAPAGVGTVDVTATTAGGTSPTSTADQFTYTAAPTITKVDPPTGTVAGGTVVTITGSNFTGATAVTFGGVAAATFTVVSDSTITATTPPGTTGDADVVVTGVGGTSTAGSFTFTGTPVLGETGVDAGTGIALGLFLLALGLGVILYRRLRTRLV